MGPDRGQCQSDQRQQEKEEEVQVNDVNRVESAGFCDRFSRVGVGEMSVGRLLV